VWGMGTALTVRTSAAASCAWPRQCPAVL
jgi:hypothetical protein